MVRKIITIFFLLLFATQLLPIRQVGKLIAGATMTEELPETGASKSTSGPDGKWFFISASYGNNKQAKVAGQSLYIYFSETLPSLPVSEIQTPPPDFFC